MYYQDYSSYEKKQINKSGLRQEGSMSAVLFNLSLRYFGIFKWRYTLETVQLTARSGKLAKGSIIQTCVFQKNSHTLMRHQFIEFDTILMLIKEMRKIIQYSLRNIFIIQGCLNIIFKHADTITLLSVTCNFAIDFVCQLQIKYNHCHHQLLLHKIQMTHNTVEKYSRIKKIVTLNICGYRRKKSMYVLQKNFLNGKRECSPSFYDEYIKCKQFEDSRTVMRRFRSELLNC
ncbi:hypothetical protein AGLY_012099 [Aphis glycines]|uniref:Uncharacterized protein n=1 Tax=Aphis glycines TaxID=307491 RepID=A0A6G0TB93_APHGL|nr:hypothetical protein AGLY_012099 [Aphis glycines]